MRELESPLIDLERSQWRLLRKTWRRLRYRYDNPGILGNAVMVAVTLVMGYIFGVPILSYFAFLIGSDHFLPVPFRGWLT
jgi:hypothetical protein